MFCILLYLVISVETCKVENTRQYRNKRWSMSKKRDIILKPKCVSHHSFGYRLQKGGVGHRTARDTQRGQAFFIAVIPIQLPKFSLKQHLLTFYHRCLWLWKLEHLEHFLFLWWQVPHKVQIAKHKSFCLLCRCCDIFRLLNWPGQKAQSLTKNLARINKIQNHVTQMDAMVWIFSNLTLFSTRGNNFSFCKKLCSCVLKCQKKTCLF